MKTIEIKNRFTNELIHSFTSENATIRDALIDAIQKKINLSCADLSDANLSGVDLSGLDLSSAKLCGSYLSGADLSNANLSDTELNGANLSDIDFSGANLSGADLSGSYLRGAELSGANLSGVEMYGAELSGANLSCADLNGSIKLPMHCKWTHGITNGNLIHIGCVKKTIEEWDIFFASDKVIHTKRNTNEFKQIQAVYEAYKSYLTFLNK